jgi:hypothetical protein
MIPALMRLMLTGGHPLLLDTAATPPPVAAPAASPSPSRTRLMRGIAQPMPKLVDAAGGSADTGVRRPPIVGCPATPDDTACSAAVGHAAATDWPPGAGAPAALDAGASSRGRSLRGASGANPLAKAPAPVAAAMAAGAVGAEMVPTMASR